VEAGGLDGQFVVFPLKYNHMNKFLARISRPLMVIFLCSFLLANPVSAVKPNDPDYFLQWYIEKINLPQAWDYTIGSPEVVVAVLDTGLDIRHPDLIDNIWANRREIPGDGIDNDHNGYIDDYHGYDFIDNDPDPSPDFSLPYEAKAITHGTLVSGIIGATGNNLRGITGVAWDVELMPLRVLDNYGAADIAPTIKAIEYAIDNGADVINLSFQGHFPDNRFREVLEKAYQAGIITISSAGNGNDFVMGYDLDKTEFFPVCYRTSTDSKLVMGVGSTDKQDKRSTFSNYGQRCIDIMAPGEKIYSTQAYRGPNTDLDSYYSGFWQGTSLAAPVVSGVAALIKSISKGFTPALIYKFITETAEPLDPLNPDYAKKLGFGRINAGKAVRAAFEYKQTHPEINQNLPGILSKFYLPNGFVVSATAGHQPEVKIFNSQYQEENKFLAYSGKFLGGVNLAVGDFNSDQREEIITGAGTGGGPHVRVFNQGGDVLNQFMAYDKNFRGGVNVAVGDVDGDHLLNIVTAPQSAGGPHIKIFDDQGILFNQFMAYDKNFRGGVNVAVGDINLDGIAEIITAPAKGNSGEVRIFNYKGRLLNQFMAYDKNFKGGIILAIGDIDNDYHPEIITGPEGVIGPQIEIFSSEGQLESQFLAFYERYFGGVKLTVGDYNFDGFKELVVAQGSGDPIIKIFNNLGAEKANFSGFSQGYTGGVNVGIIE
jgi:subtilisin family serine protease